MNNNIEKTYFGNTNKLAKTGEQIVTDILSKKYEIEDVSKNEEYFAKDIDFICSKGKEKIAIEVKTDEKSLKTGNLFFETKSNKSLGWIFKTKADYVYYVIPNNKIYVIYMPEFLPWFQKNFKNYKSVNAPTTSKTGEHWYYSWGRIISIKTIEALGFIEMIDLQQGVA